MYRYHSDYVKFGLTEHMVKVIGLKSSAKFKGCLRNLLNCGMFCDKTWQWCVYIIGRSYKN